MCGICGIVSSNPEIDFDAVKRMQNAMLHRGPDGAGDFHAEHIGMAMRRLSIIDIEGGSQPLYNEDRSLALIVNGEIYNFLELQAQLKADGHHLRTKSDSETILHLYEDHGLECVHHLRGMFAFAIWDSNKKRLIIARDRLGEKPLYLYQRDKEIIFASEFKALFSSGYVHFELDPISVDLYFHYQYVPEPRTPVKGVRKLEAGHMLIVDVNEWNIEEKCYWRMEDAPLLEGDATILIREQLEKSCELIIRADVPVGVALSGGLDSSAIAAIASKKYPDTLHAFSVGYEGKPHNDERLAAKEFAKYLGIPFHEVELTTHEIVSFFPDLIDLRDDPIADISGHGYYAVNKLSREKGVPVLLQGQGGDELFWGYPNVKQAVHETLQKFGLWKNQYIAFFNYIMPKLPERLTRSDISKWARSIAGIRTGFKRFVRDKSNPIEQMVFYDLWPGFKDAHNNVMNLYTKDFSNQVNKNFPFELFTFAQPWQDIDICMTKLISQTYLLGNGIAQGDRLSMASSVELRLPLVDYRFVETVIGLRKSYPDHALPSKFWFKNALKDILPEWVMNRRKRGFEPPVIEWQKALFDKYGEKLIGGYLEQTGIVLTETFEDQNYKSLNFDLFYKMLVLEMWCRKYAF